MKKGMLVLVATPIGNLKDITLRALEVLKNADVILCEDTRRAGKLLQEYAIVTGKESFHDFNKEKKTPRIIERLRRGEIVALISDSGTPGISDPGFYLVREAIRQNITVSSLPGPNACIAALTISGLPTDKFVFEGFLSHKRGKRRNRLQQLREEERTIVLYEAPHRIKQTMEDIRDYLGDRNVCIVRELTKLHEEIIRGKVSDILEKIKTAQYLLKGEFVIIIEGKS